MLRIAEEYDRLTEHAGERRWLEGVTARASLAELRDVVRVGCGDERRHNYRCGRGHLANAAMTARLVLKRPSASRSSGEWSDDDYDVLPTAWWPAGHLQGRCIASRHTMDVDAGVWLPRMSRPTATRAAAIAAFANSWRCES
jgi:hypothetical protein